MAAAVLSLLVVVGTAARTAHAQTSRCAASGCFSLYYQAPSWTQVFLHYDAQEGWNSIPGEAAVPSTNASFPSADGWWYTLVGGNTVTFVMTNGQGQWDNNGGKNYLAAAPGDYTLSSGVLTAVSTYPVGCPSNCAEHGSCTQPGSLCNCTGGFFGWDCSSTCDCDGHGSCDAGGSCVCSTGWATCNSSTSCSTNVDGNDAYNCGACGVTCLPDPAKGIASAQCVAGNCTMSCAAGFVLCADGTCHPGTSPSACPLPPLPGCQTYNDNQCSGNETETPVSFDARSWQTPPAGSPGYIASFQSFATLQGYARVVYDPTHLAANITVVTRQKDAAVTLSYSFDGATQAGPSAAYCAPNSAAAAAGSCISSLGPVWITVSGSDSSALVLEEVYLLWGAAAIPVPPAGDFRDGQKGGIVEMFGWPHDAVGQECATLGALGYLGAKLYPVMEQVMSWEPFQNVINPWFFAYQPVSYRLSGRMGNSSSLAAAINTCRAQSVRIYADAVVNHMVGGGSDANAAHRDNSCNEWTQKNSSAMLWANSSTSVRGVSPSYTQDFCYVPNANTQLPPSQEFPAVPYGPSDFHCERPLNSWTDPLDLNAGWLEGLVDLNTELPYVQQRIADYFTSLLSVGFSGFRIDAAKHIRPEDLVAILNAFKANLGGVLPADWVTWLEVLTGGEGDMLVCNNASGYNYGGWLHDALAAAGWAEADVDKVKIWADYYPKQPSLDCGSIAMSRKAIENDSSDMQQPGSSRDMGNAGCVLVLNCDSTEQHRQFEEELFSAPPGSTDNSNDYPLRLVLSGFYFDVAQQPYGFPDGASDCSLCQGRACASCAGSMPYTPAYNATAPGYAGPVYTRVHRDAGIVAAMRAWMQLPPLNSLSSHPALQFLQHTAGPTAADQQV